MSLPVCSLGEYSGCLQGACPRGKRHRSQGNPIPAVEENEVLVRVRAIGPNPIDVTAYRFFHETCSHRVRLYGEVVKLGPNLKVDLKVWDKVSATIALLAVSVQVASLQAHRLCSSQGDGKHVVFVYGGSSGVGQFAIQLAKLSGYKVVTVASPRNHELLKSFEAGAVFDYRDPEMVKEVKDVAGNNISHVFDPIAGNDTQLTAVKVLAEHDKPGKIILSPKESTTSGRTSRSKVLIDIFCSYGFGHAGLGPGDDARRVLSAFLQKIPELVRGRKLKCIPVKNFDGGLEIVVSDGFEYIPSGKVRAEKVVFTV
ncbi:hypothetical protein BJ322DRAFT_1108701 [Thelephora terrestris]|uniref:Enoyl reductase (ER) domain-containing protein n=1 Tax=Thelephora terrestris TaxID=56493 RepID=A0A9P6L6W4_9AGAM|nr:hypothetical protein BJ322DRAFT_1108701 [Thelephora terrestris]